MLCCCMDQLTVLNLLLTRRLSLRPFLSFLPQKRYDVRRTKVDRKYGGDNVAGGGGDHHLKIDRTRGLHSLYSDRTPQTICALHAGQTGGRSIIVVGDVDGYCTGYDVDTQQSLGEYRPRTCHQRHQRTTCSTSLPFPLLYHMMPSL